jgi:methyltransferase (TIGR00027 family)
MSDAFLEHVSDTAFLVAHHRALESARKDALFHDPFAGVLAGEKGRVIAERFRARRVTGWSVVVRTVIIDRFLREAVAEGVDTVVNLGAGLDTRPYRDDLGLPRELRWVEVDYPEVIAYKEEKLRGESPRVRLERVGLDLADDGARRGILARLDVESSKLLVLTEGVVPYLTIAEAAALADDLSALRHVDSWIVDYISPQAHAARERAGVDKEMGKIAVKFRPPDWGGFFHSHGWRMREMRYLPIEGKRLKRAMPLPAMTRLVIELVRPFTPREKREAMARTMGYARLVPTR